jgi:hypothetical protein
MYAVEEAQSIQVLSIQDADYFHKVHNGTGFAKAGSSPMTPAILNILIVIGSR